MIIVCALLGIFESALFPQYELIEENFNPARLGGARLTLAGAVAQKFNLSELRSADGFLQYRGFAVWLQSTGDAYYCEQRAGLGLSFPAGRWLTAGISADLLSCRIQGPAPLLSYSLKAGLRLDARDGALDCWLNNINRPGFATGDRLPVSGGCRLEYKVRPGLKFYAAGLGQENEPPFLRFGMILTPASCLVLQSGFLSNPAMVEYGLKFTAGIVQCQYAGSLHPRLGLSHCLGVQYQRR